MRFPHISETAWKGAAISVICVCLFMLLAYIFDNLSGAGVWIYASITSLAALILAACLAALLVLGLFVLQKMPLFYQMALAVAWVIGNFILPDISLVSFSALFLAMVVVPSILGGAFAVLLSGKLGAFQRKIGALLAFFLSAAALSWVAFWLISPGASDHSIRMFSNTAVAPLNLPNPSHPGPFHIKTLSYGSGKDFYRTGFGQKADIKTKSVDGTPFVQGWEGWTGWIRSYFWGFDASQLPLNAMVWYPEGEGPFPLILLVHGNHTMSAFSDVGYAYLGNLLASQGFITVSVDENFLNSNFFDSWSSFDEVAARGWLLLEHLALWRRWSEEPASPFYGKADMENIGLIGHSRGGEAIVTAKAFNNLPFFPDDGNVAFDFNFSIKALAAIAPKDGQYLPSGISTPLENVNYFVMHGSHDGDVRSFEGTKTYSRLVFNDGQYWFKSAVYIVGANHGQFNEVWDRLDSTLPDSLFLNLKPLMPNIEQRKIAEVYLSAFMRACLKGEAEYISLFWDARLGSEWLPETVYVTQFEDSKTAFVYSGKKDLNLAKATLAGSTISQEGLSLWRQQKVSLKWGDKLESAIFVGWKDGTGSLSMGLPIPNPIPVHKDFILTFSLADASEVSEKGGDPASASEPIDFRIELVDIEGNAASLLLSHDSLLFPQIETEVYKAQFLDTVDNSEVVFQTFRLPLRDFVRANPALQVQNLHQIRFIFDQTASGVIIIDRVGFTRAAQEKF